MTWRGVLELNMDSVNIRRRTMGLISTVIWSSVTMMTEARESFSEIE
jgi:hypothetical protein